MSNDESTRHVPSQHAATNTSDSMWLNDVQSASGQDLLPGIGDSWLLNQGLIASEYHFPDEASFVSDPTYYTLETIPIQHHSSGYEQPFNALHLDPATVSSRVHVQMDQGAHLHSGQRSPHPARMQQLPQIVTSDLPTSSRSPHMNSPVDYYTAPYSAMSSSPSSCGNNTMPMTPASLPSTSQLAPPYVNSSALLSPGSPYAWHYGSPAPKSPYSPSASISRSPSLVLYEPPSPADEIGQVRNISQQIYPSVYDIANTFPDAQLLIPQRLYRPHTQSDRRRYVEEVELEEPIMFYTSHPDGLGISCRDALNCKFARLTGRDDQMFVNRGPSVSIRLMWPGYAPWSRQIPTRDFRSPPGPITRSKLAKNVAKTVQRFIEDMKARPMEEDADPRWKVGGSRGIGIEHLELVGLQHVSMGSWQAHLRVRRAA